MRSLVEDDPDEEDGGIQKSMDEFMSEVNQYSHAEGIMVEDEVQSMHCKGPNRGTHKEEERAVEQGHALESADDQERDSGEQHAPITGDDQEGGSGEEHVQPAVNKEQPIDNEKPLSETDYMRIIDI